MFSITKLLISLKDYKALFSSVKDIYLSLTQNIKTTYYHFKYTSYLKNTLNCKDIVLAKSSYMFMGKFHLEVFPFGSILLKESHRLFDLYPFITAIDTDQESLNALEFTLDGSLCPVSTYNTDLTKTLYVFDKKFDTISINFALDKLSTLEKVEEFLLYLKSNLNKRGSIFGITTLVNEVHHSKKSLDHLIKQNENLIWFNKDRSIEELKNIFHKHFIEVDIAITGACIVFRLAPEVEKVDLAPYRPTIESVSGKFLYLNE